MRNKPKSQLLVPDKKELILNAAIPVFGKSGFKKTSIEDLADAAAISKQGLYLHFSSKEEIFQAAMQKYLEDGLNLVNRNWRSRTLRCFSGLWAQWMRGSDVIWRRSPPDGSMSLKQESTCPEGRSRNSRLPSRKSLRRP